MEWYRVDQYGWNRFSIAFMKQILIILLAILSLASCKTSTKIVEVPVEVIKKEYVYNTKIDSIYIRDSIDRWQKGDTLYITKWHISERVMNVELLRINYY